MRHVALLALVVSGAIALPSGAAATDNGWCDADDNGHIYCPEILVRGGGLPDAKGDGAYSIDSYDDIDLEQNASGRIENLIRNTPGLQQFRRSDARSANPTSQGITLRGLGGNAASRALLLVDGVPQTDPFGGWVSWAGYDALPLRSVRVRRGGGSGAEGPGALAGTVELYTLNRAADAGESFIGDVAYGSRNALSARLQYATVEDEAPGSDRSRVGGLIVGASYDRGDGFIPVVAAQRGAADRAAPYGQAALMLKANAPLSRDVEVQTMLRGFIDHRERGTAMSANRTLGADMSVRVVDDAGAWQWSALAYAQLREFSSQFASVKADRSGVTPTLDQFSVPSTGIGARMEVRRVGDASEWRIGADTRYVEGRTQEFYSYAANGLPQRIRRAGGDSVTAGLYGEYSHQLSAPLLATMSLRYDHYAIGRGYLRERPIAGALSLTDVTYARRSGNKITGRVGVQWDADLFDQDIMLRAAAYTGWRLPTLNELYRPFRLGADALAANPALKPEGLRGVEIGMRWGRKGKRLNTGRFLDVTAFRNRLTDPIANVTLASGPGVFPGVGFVAAGGAYRQRVNLRALDTRGVEVQAGLPLGPIDFEAAYSFVDARMRGGGLDGLRPAQVPKHSAGLSVAWRPDGYQGLSATLRYSGRVFEDDLNRQQLDDAVTLDLHAMIRLKRGLQLFGRAENLFNARTQASISSSGIIERASPRTLWLGLRYALD